MPASPSTTATAAELRQDLGTVAYEHMSTAGQRGHIGIVVLPPFRSPQQASKFPVVDVSQGMRQADDLRAADGHYNEVDWQFGMDSFATDDRGLEGRIDDRLVGIYGRLLPVEELTTRTTTNRILINHERRVAAKLQAGAANAEVAIEWTTAATATPHADVTAAKKAFRSRSGLLPNACAMSLTVFWALLATAEIKSALRYTNPLEFGGFEAQRRAVAAYFGVDQVLVAGGMEDASKKGQSASLADIWDDEYFHLLHISPGGEQIMEPAYGRTILWTGGSAGGGSAADDGEGMLIVETYRDETRRSDMVRVRYDVTEFTQYAAAHYKLGNISA
jgi:hypothetical protein